MNLPIDIIKIILNYIKICNKCNNFSLQVSYCSKCFMYLCNDCHITYYRTTT